MKKKEIEATFYLFIIGLIFSLISAIFEFLANLWIKLVLFMNIYGYVVLLMCSLIILFKCRYIIFEYFYYRGKKFIQIKNDLGDNAKKCNDLNQHIEELKNSCMQISSIDYGDADITDGSNFNYKRLESSKFKNNNKVHNCSQSVFKNAQQQPFKYICKYFDIKPNEDTLGSFESVFNNFSAAEQGKLLLDDERQDIVDSLEDKVPSFIIKYRREKLIEKLGFQNIDFSELYFPKYSFNYISYGGNSSMSCDVIFNLNTLERFIKFLSELVKFRKSIEGQRALMTSKLRDKIKERDNYTCQNCGLSIEDERNLLLEIDHIIPLSKGGITKEENLQTLCWKCNRSKGSKII